MKLNEVISAILDFVKNVVTHCINRGKIVFRTKAVNYTSCVFFSTSLFLLYTSKFCFIKINLILQPILSLSNERYNNYP